MKYVMMVMCNDDITYQSALVMVTVVMVMMVMMMSPIKLLFRHLWALCRTLLPTRRYLAMCVCVM